MPLLLITMDFPPHKDGITTLSKELARRLGESFDNFIVIGPKAPGDLAFDAAQHYRVYRSPWYEYGYLKIVPLLFLVPYVVLKHKVDTVIATNIGYGGVIAYLLSGFVRLTYIVTAQGYEFLKFNRITPIKNLYLRTYRKAKGIIACSAYVKDMLVRFGSDPEKIQVVYPAVDMDRFKPQQPPREFIEKNGLQGKKVVLTVARLIERKGHAYVLRALEEVSGQFPDTMYVIVGKGPERERLEKIAAEKGISDRVKFVGETTDEDLLNYYNACDMFVMPSRSIEADGHVEGFGIVFLEANACGKPAVGGRSGGVPEAIIDGKTGFLVDPIDKHDIAEKIMCILKDPALGKRLGQQGYERVRGDFSWDLYAEQFKKMVS
jgi:phosphatidylinositol alpha-1,6-mannosyltransferase